MVKTVALGFVLATFAHAQAPTGKAAAPVDLTGYYVSIITEDWRWRMITPAKSDYASIPVNAAAVKIGDAWDPAKDEAAGDQCKAYGAPALMRIPGRIHITWADDNTLKIDADAGTQTRLLHFNSPPRGDTPASLQGYSAARWEPGGRPLSTLNNGGAPGQLSPTGGGRSLEVVTTNLRPGYLRKNGIPYSANTRVSEYFDLHKEPDNTEWITITTVIEDPVYLRTNWVTSTDFRRQPDAANWNPTPCSAR